MELTTISNIIDTRLNSFDGGMSVDEYEKSLYLTKAQRIFYKELLKTFEENGIITNLLKPFVKDIIITTTGTYTGAITGAQFFELPLTVEKIIYETATITGPYVTNVIPIKAAEFRYKNDNPFRTPNNEETFRIIVEETDTKNLVELHANATVTSYNIKYFKTIIPIVLETLPTGLVIEGVSAATPTEFNEEVLDKIVDTAVLLILQDKTVQKQSIN